MYMLTEVEKVVRIPPAKLTEDIASEIDSLAWDSYEGRFGDEKMFTVLVKNVRPVGPGRIVHGDGAVYQTVKFEQVVFKPKDNEIVEGVVVEILKFGAFVRFGPLDGLLHVSQIMDDRVDIDESNQRLVGKETGRHLAVGDRVRARVVSIDLNEKNPQDSKIGLTMRQPGLGKLQWLEEDRKKRKEAAERWQDPCLELARNAPSSMKRTPTGNRGDSHATAAAGRPQGNGRGSLPWSISRSPRSLREWGFRRTGDTHSGCADQSCSRRICICRNPADSLSRNRSGWSWPMTRPPVSVRETVW